METNMDETDAPVQVEKHNNSSSHHVDNNVNRKDHLYVSTAWLGQNKTAPTSTITG